MDNTGYLVNLLTDTHTGLNWVLDFFYDARRNIADGVWDDAVTRQKFREAIMKSGPQTFLGTEVNEGEIDWERTYKDCWGGTKPRHDFERRDLRKRLEKRGIDPDKFGWDLTLPGEKFMREK